LTEMVEGGDQDSRLRDVRCLGNTGKAKRWHSASRQTSQLRDAAVAQASRVNP
jgi:hypothetical protein